MESREGGRTPSKTVFAITEPRGGDGGERGERPKNYFTRVGAGWPTKTGALMISLNALPTSGQLFVRDWDPERDARKPHDDTRPRSKPEAEHDNEMPF